MATPRYAREAESADDGRGTMRCRFTIEVPSAGLVRGGSGECKLSDGATIENVIISAALTDVEHWCDGNLTVGDFNGDGRVDQLCTSGVTGTRVALATATGFAAPTTWLTGYQFGQRLTVGDFNADGKSDVAEYWSWQGYFYVALSTGTSFTTPACSSTAPCARPRTTRSG